MPHGPTNPEPTIDEARAALWLNLTSDRPHWAESGADLTPIGLKALVELAHDQGFRAGVARGRAQAATLSALAKLRRKNYLDFLVKTLGMPLDAASEEGREERPPDHARSA